MHITARVETLVGSPLEGSGSKSGKRRKEGHHCIEYVVSSSIYFKPPGHETISGNDPILDIYENTKEKWDTTTRGSLINNTKLNNKPRGNMR